MGMWDVEWSRRQDAARVGGSFLFAVALYLIAGWRPALVWVGLSVLFVLGYRWCWGRWPWRAGSPPLTRLVLIGVGLQTGWRSRDVGR